MNAADRFLKQAARTAAQGAFKGKGGPFGAVIVKNGRVLAAAHNRVLETYDPSAHAEVNAIRTATKRLKNFDLTGTEIYSTTEPCPMCFATIHWARIGKIVYATTIADVAKLGFNELAISNQKLKKLGKSRVKIRRVQNKACSDLLKKWATFAQRRTY